VLNSVTFDVIGEQRLFCEGCEQRVESLLKALQGVRQVRAQSRDQRIEVLFDKTSLEIDTLSERLAKAGYETKVRLGSEGQSHAPKSAH